MFMNLSNVIDFFIITQATAMSMEEEEGKGRGDGGLETDKLVGRHIGRRRQQPPTW